MTENLRTTRYNESSIIPLLTDNGTWTPLNTPAYCWYDTIGSRIRECSWMIKKDIVFWWIFSRLKELEEKIIIMKPYYVTPHRISFMKFIALLTMIFLNYDSPGQSILGDGGQSYTGVRGVSQNSIGVSGVSIANAGVYGSSSSYYGVYGLSTSSHGAYFRSAFTGKFADIVLGGTDYFSGGDDGVIMSDPSRSGSDLFLTSNDAVIIELDNDFGEEGNFEIWDSDDNQLLVLQENGQFEIWNGFSTNNRRLLLEPDGDLFIDGSLSQGSDRNRKEQIRDLSYLEILEAVWKMPIYEWQYIGQDRRHIGPMAQDFHRAFGLGDDDKTISALDADGVALAAIKGQQEIIEKQQKELQEQQNQIDQLKEEMRDMKDLITSFQGSK